MKRSLFRKKGSVLIEYLVSIPLFMLMVWFPMQVSFFALSQSVAQSSAMEGARYVSLELTGTDTKKISDLSSSERQTIKDGLIDKLTNMATPNPNFLLFTKADGTVMTPAFTYDEYTCESYMNNSYYKRVVCLYITTPANGSVPQVIVRTKAPYKIIGNLFSGLSERFFARGMGVSILNNPDRQQYQ